MNLSVSRINRHGIFSVQRPSFSGLLQGGEFVTARARAAIQGTSQHSARWPITHLQPEKLRGSKFNTPDDLAAFAQKFDEGVKRVFSDDQAPQYVKFGTQRDNDANFGIRAGRLSLTG